MCTPLAKLAIGLSATMAIGFYYLAAAPPASAAIDVCGPGNFSSSCVPVPGPVPTSPASLRDPVPEVPVVESPAQIVEPTAPPPVVASPTSPTIIEPTAPSVVESPTLIPTPGPIPLLPESPLSLVAPATPNPIVPPLTLRPTPPLKPNFPPNIYTNAPALRTTTIPEPGTVVALLLTGAGIICSGRKRNKQVGQQR
jgi:hypothetical protein